MSLWLADKASGRPPTQTPQIEVDSNLFLLESRVDHETAPHLAGCRLTDISTPPVLSLMKFEENHSLACVCPRKQHTTSSALEFFASDQRSEQEIGLHATASLGPRSRCLTPSGWQCPL